MNLSYGLNQHLVLVLTRGMLWDDTLLVHVDARREDVQVPDNLRSEAQLVLRFGLDLTPPIHDLAVDEMGISGTLRFSGVPHRCILAWPAIYVLRREAAGDGIILQDHVPPDIRSGAGSGAVSTYDTPPATPADATETDPEEPTTPDGRPKLKLVN